MLKSKVGYSIEIDSFASGKEATTKAIEGCSAPKIGMLYSSCKYDEIELIKGAKSVAPDMPIIGCNSSGAIMVPDGIIANETGYSGMIVLDDPDLKVSVAASERGTDDPKEIGRKIAIEAVKKSGTMVRPSYFYMVCSPAEEEFYLKGIQDVIGRVPLFGGSCADDAVNGEWQIFCDDKVFADGCAVAFFYTDKRIVTEFTGAYNETDKRGIITKTNGNRVLAEIDGVPALTKYAEWMETTESELQGMNLLSATVLHPLGIKDPLGNLTVIRHPMVGNEDNTMNIGNNLKEGTAVCLMETTVDGLIDSTKVAMNDVKEKLDEKPGAYFLVHCGGRKLGIGDRMEEVYQKVKEEAGDTPFIMIFTFGEYGYNEHSANTCGGLMLSFTAFAE